ARLTNSKDIRLWGISAVIMTVTALTGAEIALLFVAAGLGMVLLDAPPRFLKRGGSASMLGIAVPFSVLTGTATAGTLVALGLVIPGRWFIRHRDNGQIQAFVKGATAAAAGAIAGATIVLTRQAVVDVPTVGILAVSLLFVWRLKNKEPILVLLAGVAGLLM